MGSGARGAASTPSVGTLAGDATVGKALAEEEDPGVTAPKVPERR